MREFLFGFLMLVMFTPSMACAAEMLCAEMDRQAQTGQDMPCHGDKQDSGDNNILTLFKDCSGVDLAQADYGTAVKKQDVPTSKIFSAWADIAPKYNYPVNVHQIRGPPFYASLPHINDHDLYLTTQRLRI